RSSTTIASWMPVASPAPCGTWSTSSTTTSPRSWNAAPSRRPPVPRRPGPAFDVAEETFMRPDSRFWAGLPVCVTGGTGFLGYHLVRQLLDLGAEVRVLALQPAPRHPIRRDP